MANDNVLQPIIEARREIAGHSKTLSETEALLDALIGESSDQYDETKNAFDDLMKHVQDEGTRALGVANDVAARIAAVTANAQKYEQDQATFFTAIGTDAVQVKQLASDGAQQIAATAGDLADLDVAMQDMLTRVGQSADASRTMLLNEFDRLTTAHGVWRTDLDQTTQSERDAIEADCVMLCDTEFGKWQTQLLTDIQNAQNQIDALQTRMDSEVTNRVVALGQAHDEVRQLLSKTFSTLEQALTDLGELIERLGGTLDQSTETMNDLLSAANVGLQTVIGLIDTVSQLCEEIADSWF